MDFVLFICSQNIVWSQFCQYVIISDYDCQHSKSDDEKLIFCVWNIFSASLSGENVSFESSFAHLNSNCILFFCASDRINYFFGILSCESGGECCIGLFLLEFLLFLVDICVILEFRATWKALICLLLPQNASQPSRGLPLSNYKPKRGFAWHLLTNT